MVDGPLLGLLQQQPTIRLTVVGHRGHPPHQSNEERSPLGRVLPADEFLSRSKVLPLGPGGGTALLVGMAVNEMAFELEVVVQAGVDRGELL